MGEGGDRGDAGAGLGDADALVVGEEKSSVLTEGTADGAAEFVASEGGFGDAEAVVEELVGVEGGVAEEFVDAGAVTVGAGAGLDDGDGAGGDAVLGGIVGGKDAHFLDGIDSGDHDEGAEPEVTVDHAVDEVGVVLGAGAVDGDVGVAAHGVGGGGEIAGGASVGAGAEEDEGGEGSIFERHFDHLFVGNERGDHGGLGLEEGGGCGDFDGLADVADDEAEVDGDGVGGGEFDGGADEFLEAGLFDGDFVSAGGEGVGDVLAVCVGNGFAFDAGGLVLNKDFGVGDGGTGLVGDLTGDGAVGALGQEREADGEEGEERARHGWG